MPQMAPMWWTLLLTMFIVVLMMSLTHFYFLWTEKKESKIKMSPFKKYSIRW